MLLRPLLLLLLLPVVWHATAQEKYVFSGIVQDAENLAPLYNAAVQVSDTYNGGFTDQNGAFTLSLEEGRYTLLLSYMGYHTLKAEISIPEERQRRFLLKPSELIAGEVTIHSNSPVASLTSAATGTHLLREKDIQKIPYVLGEVDPLRALQLLPGIQSAGEGNTGFFVRGGGADQNLILLDNAPIYNASHLFGFFSVFNGHTVKKMELLKGGIPSKYGGRLSSYLKITTKTAGKEKARAEGSLGLIAGSFLLETPVIKDKLSLSVAGRRTYLDLLNESVLKNVDYFGKDFDYYFYDINTKLDYRSGKDRLSVSLYSGADNFKYYGNISNHIVWKNTLFTANWHHMVNDQWALHTTAYSSNYDLNFGAGIYSYSLDMFSEITDHGIKLSSIHYLGDKHEIEAGGEIIRHRFLPNKINAVTDGAALNFGQVQQINALEYASFIDGRFSLGKNLLLSAGLRHSAYWQKGPFRRFVANDNFVVTDTVEYAKNKTIASYHHFEPRLAVRYSLNNSTSIKASYDLNSQYVHMVPMSSVSLPSDMWVPSSQNIKPQRGHQFSLGYFRNLVHNAYESSISAYYKIMDHQIAYRNGVIIGYSKGFNFDDNFYFGKGTSKGIELLVRKNSGKLTGSFSYTLSKTSRKFEHIDKGSVFPAKYDRRHDLSLQAAYQLSKRWKLMGVFVYATGNALTLPVGRYIINGNIVNEYGKRNRFRMPAYHRLDLSAAYTLKKTDNFESSLVFSCYNIYNRKNPYYLYFDVSGNLNEYHLEIEPEQVSLFPVIPSVTYRLKLM